MSENEWPYSHAELPIVARIANETAEFVQIVYRHRSDPENTAKSALLTKEDFGARYRLSPSLESPQP